MKYIWRITVEQAGTSLSQTYALSGNLKPDFNKLSERVLKIAYRDKSSWNAPNEARLRVIEIRNAGKLES